MCRTGITSFAFFPLSAANPKEAPGFIASVAKKIEEAKKGGKLPPGLAEQLDIQLETLSSDTLPDLEVVVFPGYLQAGGEYRTCSIVEDNASDFPPQLLPSLVNDISRCYSFYSIHSLVDILWVPHGAY